MPWLCPIPLQVRDIFNNVWEKKQQLIFNKTVVKNSMFFFLYIQTNLERY